MTEFELIGGTKLNISKLEEAMSPGLSYADIKVLYIRKSLYEYIPLELLFGSPHDKYVIKFTLNGKDTVVCDFTDRLKAGDFIIHDCESKNAVVNPSEVIYYKDLDIQRSVYGRRGSL